MFSGIVAIFRKELRGYFTSTVAYVVAFMFWLLAGFFFSNIIEKSLLISQQADAFGQDFDAPTLAAQNFLSLLSTLLLFLLPILTMGVYAEERRRGTMELLATSPVTNISVALGKWLAVITFLITLLLPVMAYQVITYTSTDPGMNFILLLIGYLGLVLLAGAVIAFGLFISSLTDNTLVAAIGTFGWTLLLWVLDAAAGEDSGVVSNVLRHLSLIQQYQGWVQGTISISSVVLFLSMIVLGLYLTVQSVEALRWQQN